MLLFLSESGNWKLYYKVMVNDVKSTGKVVGGKSFMVIILYL